jgi:hypothetical protein
MASGRFAEQNDLGFWSVAMVVLGGFTVASAHWLNHRLCLVVSGVPHLSDSPRTKLQINP